MATTQADIAAQMVSQLRLFDPSVSAEVGTPERKIIDTVAQALAEAQVNLNLVGGGLDIASKSGTDLDTFMGMFGFGRQQGAAAVGFVTFGRPTPASLPITIPNGTQVLGTTTVDPDAAASSPSSVTFQTTATVTLAAGATAVIAPVQALITGSEGNLAAGTITQFANIGTPPLGITTVTNAVPTTNGADTETDPELKVRFKNTVFRNQAGTKDQYLALAVATQFTTQANVIGPISRYQEYVQVPAVDDASVDPSDGLSGNGLANQWTTAQSDIPYAKYVFDNVPYFVSNGAVGVGTIFYRSGTDFVLNNPPVLAGDTYRENHTLTQAQLDQLQPNVTLLNVYSGTDTTVQLMRPADVVLLEYSYQSTATRNDATRSISNAVDVYINGQNAATADAIIPPVPPGVQLFTANPVDTYYYQNYRRLGEPDHRPVPGNAFTALFWQPVIGLPAQISVGSNTYLENVHYWGVEDVTLIGSTVRSRNGIEWLTTLPGMTSGDNEVGPYTGDPITTTGASSISVLGYIYDQNIIDLQTALEGSKQVTTDVLAHQSRTRYFRLDITVMYAVGATPSVVNLAIQTNLATFFDGQYFGTVIQLSDLLQVVHNTGGVDNVRWSKELLSGLTDASGNPRDRVVECDVNGNPRTGPVLDRVVPGGLIAEVWQLYMAGAPTGGTFTISQGANTSTPIPYNFNTTSLNAALAAATPSPIAATSTVTGGVYTITFSSTGYQTHELTSTSLLTGGTAVFNSDFFLLDEELPALPSGQLTKDTVAGLVIRPRAQNVWSQL